MKLASIFLDKIKCPMYFFKFNALVCLLIYLTYILKYIITVRCMYICMLVDVCIVYLYYWFLYVDLKVTHENCSMNVNWSILSSLFYHSIRLDYLLQPSPSVIFFSLHFLGHTFLPLWHFSSLSSTSQPHCLFPSFFHYSLKKGSYLDLYLNRRLPSLPPPSSATRDSSHYVHLRSAALLTAAARRAVVGWVVEFHYTTRWWPSRCRLTVTARPPAAASALLVRQL